MRLTNAEKLNLLLLCDIAEGKRECDPAFIREAIMSDNTWGISWQLTGVPFDRENTPDHVLKTAEILEMFTSLEYSYDSLTANDKKEVDTKPGSPKFKGFDGNNESEYLSVLEFFVNHLNRFTNFKGRENLNSHTPKIVSYTKMVFEWKRHLSTQPLSKENIIKILEASISA